MKNLGEGIDKKIEELKPKADEEQPSALKTEDLDALKAELAAAQTQVQEKIGSLEQEINTLKENPPAKEASPAKAEGEAAAETAENAQSAETATKL